MVIKRKVKSEVSIRVKQSKKGTHKGEPIVATVRIGQPIRRGGSVAERTGKTILPAFQGALAAQAALGIRGSDFTITAGFRNLENQQQNLFRSLEEQKKQLMNMYKDTSQLMAERAGLRIARTGRIAGNEDMESISSRTTYIPPTVATPQSQKTDFAEYAFDEETTARKIEKLQQAILAQVRADPRRTPSIASSSVSSLASSVLSEPPPDIQEAAGAEMEIPTVGRELTPAGSAAAARTPAVRERTPMDIMAEEERKADAIAIPRRIQQMRLSTMEEVMAKRTGK